VLRAGAPRTVTGGDALVRAAALKLRRQGVGERERDGRSIPATLILPGRVWIYARVFEEDATLLRRTVGSRSHADLDDTGRPSRRAAPSVRAPSPARRGRPGTFVA
jgi:hypothetical protein